MKIQEMKNVAVFRKNLIGFLHFSETLELNEIFNENYEVNDKSFKEICDKAIDLYLDKKITNKQASEIFEILKSVNTCFRNNAYRFDNSTKSLYEFDEEVGTYVFYKKSTNKEYKSINYLLD